MGGKRNKFERIYSESENDSNEEESPEKLENQNPMVNNGNNSNSSAISDSQGNHPQNYQNDKFLITRSKKKYDKPQLKFNLKRSKIDDTISGISESNSAAKNLQNEEERRHQPPEKRKRETIKSLDEKSKMLTVSWSN